MSVDNYDMMTCPYDCAHRVTAKRFVRHLLKCRRNHKKAEMSVCPYNARHVVPAPEFRYHLKYCLDGRLIEEEETKLFNNRVADESKGDTAIPPPMSYSTEFGEEENWDEEMKRENVTKKQSELLRRLRRPHNFPNVQRHLHHPVRHTVKSTLCSNVGNDTSAVPCLDI